MDAHPKNCFYHDSLFGTHFKRKYASKRIHDFEEIHKILKNKLVPKNSITVLEDKLDEYILAHKPENRMAVKMMLSKVVCVDFKEFHQSLKNQINFFNEKINKPYVLVIGTTSIQGDSIYELNIYKSNFWVMLISYPDLKKPIDIVFNLLVAMRMYPEVNDFLILDDCSYSGQQFESIIGSATNDFKYKDNGSINKKWFFNWSYVSETETKIKTVTKKITNLHLIVPYISYTAQDMFNRVQMLSEFNLHLYNEYVIKNFTALLDYHDLILLRNLYSNFLPYNNFGSLTPIIFQHKIADNLSTIALVLINGQVLDNKEFKIPFIKECIYSQDNKNPDLRDLDKKSLEWKVSCPVPPYASFKTSLKKFYGNHDDLPRERGHILTTNVNITEPVVEEKTMSD